MRREINLEEAIGRPLEGYAFSYCGQAALAFSGGVFVTLGVLRKESDDSFDVLGEQKLDALNFNDRELDRLGILSFGELRTMYREARLKRMEIEEHMERKEYERLKLKYDNK
jgi:hypothetical protein